METVRGANVRGPEAAAAKGGRLPAAKETVAARKVAREFESLFVGMMLKSMRETVGHDKLTGGGHGEEIYRSMLDQEYAKALAERGGIGLSALVERQLDRQGGNGARRQGMGSYDTTNTNAKTEVGYENR